MLTTFGIFWGAEGAAVTWPGGEVAILGVLVVVILVSLGLVTLLRQQRERALAAATPARGTGD
jgi:uncharacterized membrane protein